MVARLCTLVMACGIILDSSAFMFRVTEPGDEGTTALLNVGIHLPSTRRNFPKNLMLDRTALRVSVISSVVFTGQWLSFANGEVSAPC